MVEQPQGSQKSGFGHYMLTSQGIVELKANFENKILLSDFSNIAQREEIISLAKIEFSELHVLLSDEDKRALLSDIARLETISNNMLQTEALHGGVRGIREEDVNQILFGQISVFRKELHQFLDDYILFQDRSNLHLNRLKDIGEMQKYLHFNEVGIRFANSYGVYISPQMEFFCRGLALRAAANQNNIIIIGAKMGKGKTTFAISGATTLSKMLGVPFSVEENIILGESRAYCEKKLATLPPGSSLIFDQAGNQMSAASRWEDDQVNLLNKVDLNRFHRMTLWVNWHATKALDKDIRERVSTHEIAIDKIGGPAIVKGFNLNPKSSGEVVDSKDRKKVVITPDQAAELSERDVLKLIEVPFFPLDKFSTPEAKILWDNYAIRKERSIKFLKKIVGKTGGVDYFYDDFLASFELNTVRISAESLEAYGVSKHTYLSIRELAKRIAHNTGRKRLEGIFFNTNPIDSNEGYIIVDKFSGMYIERLIAGKRGAQQINKEESNA